MTFLSTLEARLGEHGLNHLGVVSRARYDAVAPPDLRVRRLHPVTQSIVVVGSGGREHWRRFLAYLGHDPRGRLALRRHPLDDYTADVFRGLGDLVSDCLVVFPTLDSPTPLDFMKLAALGGLGRPSKLGILVSPRFGPWFGLRAAVFSPLDLGDGTPVARLCDDCPAPCVGACPPGVVGPDDFRWADCTTERRRGGSPCRARCGAREACIALPAERYDELEITYHYDRAEGRRLLCALFDVTDETTPE